MLHKRVSQVRFLMGIRGRVATLLPETWYVACYKWKDGTPGTAIITRITRAYYEQVDNPGVYCVSFRTPVRRYGRIIDSTQVRGIIQDRLNEKEALD